MNGTSKSCRPVSWCDQTFVNSTAAPVRRLSPGRKFSVQHGSSNTASTFHSLKESTDNAGGFKSLSQLRAGSLSRRQVNPSPTISDDSGFLDGRRTESTTSSSGGSRYNTHSDGEYEDLDVVTNRHDDDDDSETIVEDSLSDITIIQQHSDISYMDVSNMPPLDPTSRPLSSGGDSKLPPALPPRRRRSVHAVPADLKNGEATIPRAKYAEQIRRAQKSLSRVASQSGLPSTVQPIISSKLGPQHSRSATTPPKVVTQHDLLPPNLPPRLFREMSMNGSNRISHPELTKSLSLTCSSQAMLAETESHDNFHQDSYISARGYTRSGFRGQYRQASTELHSNEHLNNNQHQHSVSSPSGPADSVVMSNTLTTSMSVPQGFADLVRKSSTVPRTADINETPPPVVNVRSMASVFERCAKDQDPRSSPDPPPSTRISQSFLSTPRGHVGDISKRFEKSASSSQESLHSVNSPRRVSPASSLRNLRDAFHEDLRASMSSSDPPSSSPSLPVLETEIDDELTPEIEQQSLDVTMEDNCNHVSTSLLTEVLPSRRSNQDLISEISSMMQPSAINKELLLDRKTELQNKRQYLQEYLNQLSTNVLTRIRQLLTDKCKSDLVDDYNRFISRSDAIVKLTCQLNRRRGRLERANAKESSDRLTDQLSDVQKREEEAAKLRDAVDSSYTALETSMKSTSSLSDAEVNEYLNAVKERLTTMRQDQELLGQIELADEQLEEAVS